MTQQMSAIPLARQREKHVCLRTSIAVVLNLIDSSVISSVLSHTSCKFSPLSKAALIFLCIACFTSATCRRVSWSLSKPYFCTSLWKAEWSCACVFASCPRSPNCIMFKSANGIMTSIVLSSSFTNLSVRQKSCLTAQHISTCRDFGRISVSSPNLSSASLKLAFSSLLASQTTPIFNSVTLHRPFFSNWWCSPSLTCSACLFTTSATASLYIFMEGS
mmetsp:Transcript_7415/g.10401  ORF Transcript_7415/g.10401 Transcript_7415/m.10401 type:complete len:218 (+) Transcript_7415:232-885(+)